MSPLSAWIRFGWGVAAAGLVAYAAILVTTSPGDHLNSLANLWLYQGLIVLSVVMAGARARLVERDRAAWTVITASLACTAFAELYFAIVKPTGYPSVADFGWIAFYPLVYVGILLLLHPRASPLTGTLWLDGGTAS